MSGLDEQKSFLEKLDERTWLEIAERRGNLKVRMLAPRMFGKNRNIALAIYTCNYCGSQKSSNYFELQGGVESEGDENICDDCDEDRSDSE